MKDVQNQQDGRGVAIQRVGVKDVHFPFQVREKDNGFQSVLGQARLSVDLPHHFKGTHLSRFIEILLEWSRKPVSTHEVEDILRATRTRLDAERAHLDLRFKYFVEKVAPVSKVPQLMDYDVEFSGDMDGEVSTTMVAVEVPITTLCPCSKEISKYGAHNQRSVVRVQVRFAAGRFIWIEGLIRAVEGLGSCELFPLLKREDEKYVTERAYENPKFVEDVLRDTVLMLRGDDRVDWFEASCESFESIHNHNAFAWQVEDLAAQRSEWGVGGALEATPPRPDPRRPVETVGTSTN
ncbi:MAG: GTP cyclohydrolase I FolE2 [Armatimonadetes bacterium]|nr:GTP cyclohydrolase I FolE2 [Armatimonadota bacterium]